MKSKMKTKFGTATLRKDGYYHIRTTKEGNYSKLLHRLIWEDFYGVKIPKGFVIHHKNGDKSDNCILNLQLMRISDHHNLHNTINNPMKNKSHSYESCKKMSINKNPLGYFRVTKQICRNCKDGFVYSYRYYDDNNERKSISSVSLSKLKEKVISKGLIWEKKGDKVEV